MAGWRFGLLGWVSEEVDCSSGIWGLGFSGEVLEKSGGFRGEVQFSPQFYQTSDGLSEWRGRARGFCYGGEVVILATGHHVLGKPG